MGTRQPGLVRVRDEFEQLGELGRGGAGRVFLARHRASGREVAIKSLLTYPPLSPTARERMLREGRIRVDSPHVVQVFDVRIEEEMVYIIMERVQGETLRERLRGGPFSVQDALRCGEQVARGLEATHAAGLVHRDVKPENVFVTASGLVKLGDFGLAKTPDALESLTRSRMGMGTLAYVAPEQAANAKHVDGRADLYSLGATLYHLLAGRPPFLPESPELMVEIFDEDPPPLMAFRPDCPPAVEDLVLRLLEKDPAERPATAGEVAAALGALR